MKKALLTLALLLAFGTVASAEKIDSLFIDVRGSFLQETSGSAYASTIAPEFFNIHLFGHITDNLSYRIRQRMNVAVDKQDPFRATDWLCLNWQVNDKLRFYAGKTAILIGGYEYDSAPIDVYFYSLFCSNLSQGFAFSVGGDYEFAPKQKIAYQISNSPLTTGYNQYYSYNLAWDGWMCDWWKTIWSFNAVENPNGRPLNFIALGNHCVWDGLAVDVDFVSHNEFDIDKYLTNYSIISKVIYTHGKWNFCGKVGYETVGNLEYIYGGTGIEYFPLGDDRLRLHLAAFNDTLTGFTTITTGVKWKFRLI